MGGALLVLVAAWVPYCRTSDAYCSKCWAAWRVDEYGLAWDESSALPLRRTATLTKEPPDSIRRFLAADHVHDAFAPGMGWSFRQLFGSAIACGHGIPVGGFASALESEPEFATFLDARIADGSLDVATVRALIAFPPDRLWNGGHAVDAPLLDEGRVLYAAFSHRTGRGANVWEYWPPSAPTAPVLIDDR
jgi:hypothetical protein